MGRALRITAVAAGLGLALAAAALASSFLPKRATYSGSVAKHGALRFKVRRHHIVLITGTLPVRKRGRCDYAKKHRMALRLYQYDPVGNGPFKINATQRVNPHTKRWRRLKLHAEGQFDSSAQHASGTLHATLHDHGGQCKTRELPWHVDRR